MKAGKFSDGKIVVCGEVNGKNSYGGYTGFQLFSVQLNQDGSLEFGGFGVDDFFVNFIQETCIPVRAANE
jgi:hypothetical protein